MSPTQKCWWYAIDFTWRSDGTWRYWKISDTKGDLMIPDHKKVDQYVIQKDPSVGMKGLGVFLAPDGNDVDQFNDLLTKVQAWSENIRQSFIS